MRRLCTGLLAAALTLGLLAVEPAQAKVYKMDPDERAAAIKEKKAKRTQAKKSGKAAPGHDQGGWVEVKPGEKIAKKNKKSKVDDIALAAEAKGKKSKKAKAEAAPEPKGKKTKKDALAAQEPKAKKAKAADEIVVEKKGKKTAKADKVTAKKSGRKSASSGDRVVGSNYGGERKVSATSTEVRRPAPPASDDLNSYSVSRPGQDKAPVVPEVRQEVQPGPVDTAKPVGTEHKSGEGRF